MRISAAGLRLIASFEGLRLVAYRDAVGVLTIGYGHTAGVRAGQRISTTRALELLRQDATGAQDAVNRLVKVPINHRRFDALVSFVFNVGAGAFAASTLLRKLNARDYRGASAQFPKWSMAGGHVLAGLAARRAAERTLFDTHPG